MIQKDKLIQKVAKNANISESKAILAYETILNESGAFKKQHAFTIEAKVDKLVKVASKPKIQKVEVIREVPVEVIKTIEKIKTVEVVKEVLYEVIKEVEKKDVAALLKWKEKAQQLQTSIADVKSKWSEEVAMLKKELKATQLELNQVKKANHSKSKVEYVEVIKEVPVEVIKTVEKIKKVEVVKEVPYEVIKEVIKEIKVEKQVPYEVIKEITLIKEVEKLVEVPVEIYVKDEIAVNKWKDKANALQETIDQYKHRINEIQTAAKEAVSLLKTELQMANKRANAKPTIEYVETIKEVKVPVVKEVVVKDENVINKWKEKVDHLNMILSELRAELKSSKLELSNAKKTNATKPKVVYEEVIKEVKVSDEAAINKLKSKLASYEEEITSLKLKLKEKPKVITKEIIKEVPVEVIREVEVVKSVDLTLLKEMMAKMKTKEVSKTVIGETRTEGDAIIVDKREVKPGTNKLDDLAIIEGIGPKIAVILHRENIYTFEQLSNSSVNKLQSILDKAGPKFNAHNPSTWPAQAKLAAQGKWDELKAWQIKLIGGK